LVACLGECVHEPSAGFWMVDEKAQRVAAESVLAEGDL
jgi:hypothetical protein